jgi:hypothetical protein
MSLTANILLNNLPAESFPFTLKDLKTLELVNKDFKEYASSDTLIAKAINKEYKTLLDIDMNVVEDTDMKIKVLALLLQELQSNHEYNYGKPFKSAKAINPHNTLEFLKQLRNWARYTRIELVELIEEWIAKYIRKLYGTRYNIAPYFCDGGIDAVYFNKVPIMEICETLIKIYSGDFDNVDAVGKTTDLRDLMERIALWFELWDGSNDYFVCWNNTKVHMRHGPMLCCAQLLNTAMEYHQPHIKYIMPNGTHIYKMVMDISYHPQLSTPFANTMRKQAQKLEIYM